MDFHLHYITAFVLTGRLANSVIGGIDVRNRVVCGCILELCVMKLEAIVHARLSPSHLTRLMPTSVDEQLLVAMPMRCNTV